MSESLGMELRKTREAKGLTIEQLSVITKINPSFIIALENGRWDLLPGRVYLKTFTKLCAEALGLDVNELYSMIDGISGEKPKSEIPKIIEPAKTAAKSYTSPSKKKTDFKLPITAVLVLLLIAAASIIVKTRIMHPRIAKNEMDASIPFIITGPPKWERPWERPAADIAFFDSQRLRLEATLPVWVRVIADSDTAFTGIMPPDSGQTFTSDNGFLVSVGKNDRVKVYLNGIRVSAFGAGEGPLKNYPVGIKEKNE